MIDQQMAYSDLGGAWAGAAPERAALPGLYQGVALRRVFAYALDLVLIAILAFAVWLLFGLLNVMTFGLLTPLGVVLFAVLPLAYHSLLIAWQGGTLGMRLLDLEVRTWSGRRPDLLQAVVMTMVFYVTVWLTAWLVLLVALFNRRRRTLHDYLCNLVVVRASALP